MKKINQSGVTIVEVLIVLAILSFSMGAAYALTNRAFVAVREAQERSEAVKHASTQLELAKQAASINNPDVFINHPYCLNSANPINIKLLLPVAVNTPVPDDRNSDTLNNSRYPNECVINKLYYESLSYDTATNDLVSRVRWPGLRTGNLEVVLRYKLIR